MIGSAFRMVATVDDFCDPWSSADAVVLQHGFCRTGRLWRGWIPYLARRHRVVRPDLVGCGRADKPPEGYEYSQELIVEQVLQLIDELGIERFHWVGEGAGAVVGAMVAIERPEALLSFTGLSVPGTLAPEIQANHRAGHDSMDSAVAELGIRGWWLAARSSGGDLTGDPSVDGYIADEVALTPPHLALALSRWTLTWSFEALLPQLDVPVFLAWAEQGLFVDADERDRLTGLARDGRQHVVAGVANQLFPYTHVDEIAPVVARFVDDVETKGSSRP